MQTGRQPNRQDDIHTDRQTNRTIQGRTRKDGTIKGRAAHGGAIHDTKRHNTTGNTINI